MPDHSSWKTAGHVQLLAIQKAQFCSLSQWSNLISALELSLVLKARARGKGKKRTKSTPSQEVTDSVPRHGMAQNSTALTYIEAHPKPMSHGGGMLFIEIPIWDYVIWQERELFWSASILIMHISAWSYISSSAPSPPHLGKHKLKNGTEKWNLKAE